MEESPDEASRGGDEPVIKRKSFFLKGGAVAVVGLIALGLWVGLRMVEAKVTYQHMARAAGDAYGLYYLEKGVWPNDLAMALEYAYAHAQKDSWLYSVTHNEELMEYLNDMEVVPGTEKELSVDMAEWAGSDEGYRRVMHKGRLEAPLKVKSRETDEGDRVAFTREFYAGIVITLSMAAQTRPSGE